MKSLKKATESEHIGAKYVISLIQVLIGEDELKRKGIIRISTMKETKTKQRALGECAVNI